MDAIDKMYIREKHFNLKYYDTLKLAMLLHLEYLYSYKRSSEEVMQYLRFKKSDYTSDELKELLNNAILILKIKHNIGRTKAQTWCLKEVDTDPNH